MSGEYLEISIVKAEGFLEVSQSIGCYVQVDGRLHDVITPLHSENQENEVLVPEQWPAASNRKEHGFCGRGAGQCEFRVSPAPDRGLPVAAPFLQHGQRPALRPPRRGRPPQIADPPQPQQVRKHRENAGGRGKSPQCQHHHPRRTPGLPHKEKNRHELRSPASRNSTRDS